MEEAQIRREESRGYRDKEISPDTIAMPLGVEPPPGMI
jgi:hypothetical protein